jgi:hypothetical protein
MNVAELIRTTTEPLNGATLREILQAQQQADAGRVEIVKPLNLWKK